MAVSLNKFWREQTKIPLRVLAKSEITHLPLAIVHSLKNIHAILPQNNKTSWTPPIQLYLHHANASSLFLLPISQFSFNWLLCTTRFRYTQQNEAIIEQQQNLNSTTRSQHQEHRRTSIIIKSKNELITTIGDQFQDESESKSCQCSIVANLLTMFLFQIRVLQDFMMNCDSIFSSSSPEP